MKIGVLCIGNLDSYVADRILENLKIVFSKADLELIADASSIPEAAYDDARKQYRSDIILDSIRDVSVKEKTLDRVLGIANVDIYVPRLNFVFGEAERPGKVALISLWRLKPEFYGGASNEELFVERITKEAVHELGHTFGLGHCSNPFCVMFFSNSIFETDRKQSLFCNKCFLKVEVAINRLALES